MLYGKMEFVTIINVKDLEMVRLSLIIQEGPINYRISLKPRTFLDWLRVESKGGSMLEIHHAIADFEGKGKRPEVIRKWVVRSWEWLSRN